MKFLMNIIELPMFDYFNFSSIFVSIKYCDVDNWFCGGLLSWSKQVLAWCYKVV